MSSVLGVSVGAGAIRLARPPLGVSPGVVPVIAVPESFELRTFVVPPETPSAERAALSVAAARNSDPTLAATVLACRDENQARALHTAMGEHALTDYEIVPDIEAVMEFAVASGALKDVSALAVFDLGASGLSVTVVDVPTRQVRHVERTGDVSGEYFDSLIREQQINSGRIAHPPDPAGLAELDALCRSAKERLSAGNAVALPSSYGPVLLTQENFTALVGRAVETSARATREVIERSGRPVQAVLAIGGGVRIPLVSRALRDAVDMPVLVPPQPETATARGAALLAGKASASKSAGTVPPGDTTETEPGPSVPAGAGRPDATPRDSAAHPLPPDSTGSPTSPTGAPFVPTGPAPGGSAPAPGPPDLAYGALNGGAAQYHSPFPAPHGPTASGPATPPGPFDPAPGPTTSVPGTPHGSTPAPTEPAPGAPHGPSDPGTAETVPVPGKPHGLPTSHGPATPTPGTPHARNPGETPDSTASGTTTPASGAPPGAETPAAYPGPGNGSLSYPSPFPAASDGTPPPTGTSPPAPASSGSPTGIFGTGIIPTDATAAFHSSAPAPPVSAAKSGSATPCADPTAADFDEPTPFAPPGPSASSGPHTGPTPLPTPDTDQHGIFGPPTDAPSPFHVPGPMTPRPEHNADDRPAANTSPPHPISGPVPRLSPEEDPPTVALRVPEKLSPRRSFDEPPQRPQRGISAAMVVVSVLVVVASIGVGLGYGQHIFSKDSATVQSTAPTSSTPARTTPPSTVPPSDTMTPSEHAPLAEPPPAYPSETEAPPTTTGPNTFQVPGLPPIVVPTIPPEALPFPPPSPER